MAREAILHRTLRLEERNGRFRMFDWNLVNTSNGGCWEPRNFQESAMDGTPFYPDDCINRIDRVSIDIDWRDPYHSEGGQRLMGGHVVLGVERSFSDDAV